MKKKIPIRMLTIALFALAGLIASLAIYQQYAVELKPFSISHKEAIKIALTEVDKEPNRDAALYPNVEAGAKLIHVTDGGKGFVVNENSLTDMWLYPTGQKFLDVYENKFLWHVDVYTTTDEGASTGYWYLIDANSGKVVGNDRDYAAFATS